MFKKLRENFSLRLLVSYVVIFMLSITAMGGIYYYMTTNVLQKNTMANLKLILQQIESGCDRKMAEVRNIGENFVYDTRLYYYLNKEQNALGSHGIINDYLTPKASTMLTVANSDISIKLYIQNDSIPEVYYTSDRVYRRLEILHMSRIENSEFYRDYKAQGKLFMWQQVENDAENNNISLLMNMIDDNAHQSGLLRVVVNIDDLFGNVKSENLNNQIYACLYDSSGKVIYKNHDIKESDMSNYLQSSHMLEQGDIKLVLYVPRSVVFDDVNNTFKNIMLVGFLLLCLILTGGLFILKNMYRNFNNIMAGIEQFQNGNLDYSIPVERNDEFGRISIQLNRFSSSISQLIDDVTNAMIQTRDMEYQTLRAKVNPHFLYNILSIIGRQAKAGKTQELEKMIKKTALFYRMALSDKGEDKNTLAGEVNFVKSYVDILNIQYKNNIKVSYDINDILLNCVVPPFIIQPFVENAVKHAMVDGKISIIIKAYINDDMLFINIVDDGIGMTEETLKKLTTSKECGYGVYNVNMRLRLRYDNPKYAVGVESRYNEGTKIIISLPYEQKEDADV